MYSTELSLLLRLMILMIVYVSYAHYIEMLTMVLSGKMEDDGHFPCTSR